MIEEKDIIDLMRVALEKAKESPDTSTQNGAVVATVDTVNGTVGIVGVGCNKFHNGVKPRLERPEKYEYIEHAERSAIWDFLQGFIDQTIDISDDEELIMVCPWAACGACANAIVGAGIKKLYTFARTPENTNERWNKSCEAGDNIMKEAGLEIIYLDHLPEFGIELLRDGVLRKF